ncbi:MAG: DNA helicase PcrA [Dehalococcoidia bacterium]|nr:DNA helicase PcrA [Dehalococcoidia bacterium]MDD5495367.1 DNA helicase PcrA [Dehalococcoidia bacterium]
MDVISSLNPAQKEAVKHIEGPLLILAGPGSGKTRVITHRIAYLVKTCGVSPRRIMAVTFTNKAAREMKERLEKLLGQVAESLTVGTFHAICARILRQDGKAVGLDNNFVIYDEEDQLSLVKQCLKDLDLDPKQYNPQKIRNAISYAKSQHMTSHKFASESGSYWEEVVARIYARYQEQLEQSNTVDFDDLLMKVVHLFEKHTDVLEKYQSRYMHLLVDEFQDTNITQYKLIRMLGGKYRNVCVVGDPDQSIYSWRFADIRNILSFEKDYPDASLIVLEQNYRSTKNILEAASGIISLNSKRKPKELWTNNLAGTPVFVVKTYSEQDEAQFVVNEILKLSGNDGIKPGECAVMYRTNAQSRALEEAFMRYGLKYKLVGGTRFYQRREIKDVIAYLRVIQNPFDNISLARIIKVPGRGIGQRTLSDLTNWARENNLSLFAAIKAVSESTGPSFTTRIAASLTGFYRMLNDVIVESQQLRLVDLMDTLLEKSGYRNYIQEEEDGEERWENILELRTVALDFDDLAPGEGLAPFLEQVSLVSDADEIENRDDTTTLITLHQAKGLEFPVVFIVGMEEGLLPHRRSMEEGGDELEEERRLCYVGVTRAQKHIYLLHTARRSIFGSSGESVASRFLGDIPEHLVEHRGLAGVVEPQGMPSARYGRRHDEDEGISIAALLAKKAQAAQPREQIDLNPGDRVRHNRFGDGQVIGIKPTGADKEVIVAFEGVGVKKLLLSMAPLEKI